ncbi:MAG: hypothetical protein [Olavius algarvensis Delta 4 endosymbiont]|nr:MAG: hypothetical protein [Olavius algarvensis Delta 4 endosymbiont]
MRFNRDRRVHQINPNGSSADKDNNFVDRRSGIDRRSGKDRRYDYDEQRKAVRHKLSGNANVVLTQPRLFKFLKPEATKLAIIDISMGGLQAQYVGTDMHQYEKNILSVETVDGALKIENIPYKVITDYSYTHLPNNTSLRRCGIKFDNLSDNQIRQIKELIAKCS